MKEITWSEVRINNASPRQPVLPKPYSNLNYYRDIAIYAFPSPEGDTWLLPDLKPEVRDTAGNLIPGSEALFDGNPKTTTPMPGSFDIVLNREEGIGSIMLKAVSYNFFTATVSAPDTKAGKFRTLTEFRANNAGPFTSQIGVGTFARTRTQRLRITMNPCRLEEIGLSGGSRLDNWAQKAGWGTQNLSPPAGATSATAVSVMDIISQKSIIDLTGRLEPNGTLNWTAPAGEWTVLRIGYTTNGIKIYPAPEGGDGLECDKLSREGTVFNHKQVISPILEKMGPELSKVIASQHIDSYEASGQNWTQDFAEEFRSRCGYNLREYLPALTGRIVGSESVTERFLWDFRRTIGDLFAENHFGGAARESHKDGLTFSNEPYGGPFDFLKSGAAADFPMDEFWIPATQPKERKLVLPGVNTGRTNNKRILGVEAFTSESPAIRWNDHPYMLKAIGDYVFCSGVNRFTFHVSAHQPLVGEHLAPGVTCFGNGLHFDRNTTWWKHGAKEYIGYIIRCQSMLQQGEHVADVLYFQGSDSPADIKWLEPQLPVGYDFDACSEDVLMKLSVTGNLVSLAHGKTYRYLVLPASGRMTTPTLVKVLELARAGATIVGAPVGEAPGLSDDLSGAPARRIDAKRQLWGDAPGAKGSRTVGTGRVIWGSGFQAILDDDHLAPDFSYTADTGLLVNYIHRSTDTEEIYFVANGKKNSGLALCRFRARGLPELYRPDEGTIKASSGYKTFGDIMEIPIRFDPSGSLFVVFRKSAEPVPDKNPEPELFAYNFIRADGPWQVSFPKGWGAPENSTFRNLISWTGHPDEGIRYFSGTAVYTTRIAVPEGSLPKGASVWLNLGRVEVIAEVAVNGKSIGTLWKPPFNIDVTDAVKGGDNDVQITVTNLWPNRLIGDERQFPADESYNGKAWKFLRAWPQNAENPLPDPRRYTFTVFRAWSKDDALLPSGLIGPVYLSIQNEINK
jgi:hypothetical protein